LLKNYLVKLAVSDKVVRQKADSSKNSSKKLIELVFLNLLFGPKSSSEKLFYQIPKLSFLLDQTTNFVQKILFDQKAFQKAIYQTSPSQVVSTQRQS